MTAERLSTPGEAAQAEKREKRVNNNKILIIIIKTAHKRGAVLSCRPKIKTKKKKTCNKNPSQYLAGTELTSISVTNHSSHTLRAAQL